MPPKRKDYEEVAEVAQVPAQPEQANKPAELPELLAGMAKFIKDYANIAPLLDRFMVDFRRYRFDLVQAENARIAMAGRLKEAELKLARIEAESQTRLESVEMGHRALVERLTEEKVKLQNEREDLAKKVREAERMKQDYELLHASEQKKLAGLTAIAGAA